MIYNMTFMFFGNERQVAQPTYKTDEWGYTVRPYVQLTGGKRVIGYHRALREHLENSEDVFLWTYSKTQKDAFDKMLKANNLEQYVIFHSPMVTNPNYNQRRVATCIMKGKKQNAETQADAGL